MSTSALATGARFRARWLPPLLWILMTLVVAFGLRTLPWREALGRLQQVSGMWVVAALSAYGAILPVWALEWRLLAPGDQGVPWRRMFEVVAVMAAVLNSVPFFAGEASGVAMLIGRARLTRGAALSVLAMDQLVGGLVKIAAVGAAAVLVPLPAWLRTGILALIGGTSVMLVCGVLLAHRWTTLRARLLQRPSTARALAARAVGWGAHLGALREGHRVWRVTALACTRKLMEVVAILAVQMAFGVDPSIRAAVLVVAALGIATMLPLAPANLGVYEATVFAAYRYVGVAPDAALSLAVMQHVAFLVPMLATGYLTLTLRQALVRAR